MTLSHYQRRDRWSTKAGEWVLFALAWTFRWITRPLPAWTMAGLWAPVGGALAVAVPSFRRRAEENLALVWPDRPAAERRRIARAAGAHFARLAVEYGRIDRFLRDFEVAITGAEHPQAARAEGRGAVLVTAHYGNWEAARIAALRLGCETGIIYRAFNNRYLDRYAVSVIHVAGRPVLQKGRQGMRQLVRHVEQGGFVLILVDQRNSGAPFLDFLGHPAETVTAAAELARKTGAALIPVRATRNLAARRFDVAFESPVTGDEAGAMMAEVNRRIGVWIEEHPEQWFWFHRRWRQTSRSRALPEREG